MLKMQAKMHFSQLSLLPLEALSSCLRVFNIATNNDPRQMEPKEVVVARLKDLRVGLTGIPTPDKKYQDANNPLAVTCTIFLTTWLVQ